MRETKLTIIPTREKSAQKTPTGASGVLII